MLRLWQVCYKEVLSWPSPGGTKMPRTNPPTWHPLHRVIRRLVIPVMQRSGMVAVAVWSLLLARHHCNSNDGKEANHRSHPERNGRTLMHHIKNHLFSPPELWSVDLSISQHISVIISGLRCWHDGLPPQQQAYHWSWNSALRCAGEWAQVLHLQFRHWQEALPAAPGPVSRMVDWADTWWMI